MWFTGPQFLQSKSELARQLVEDKVMQRLVKDDDPEVKQINIVNATTTPTHAVIYLRKPVEI